MQSICAGKLKEWLHDGEEIVLLDVREHGEYGVGHLFYAVPLPYSRLEMDIDRLVPRKSVRLVVYDDGRSGVAAKAARRALSYGYCAVFVLEGGTAAWTDAGFGLFAGVNVVSKAFGELVEHAEHVPSIGPDELNGLLQRNDDIVVIDGRPIEEYRKMSIPQSICCPNGELAYRIGEIVPDPDTTIVVNCAGRTRSIIGAATLRRLGIANPVFALRNGTMGWALAGLSLDHGKDRLYPSAIDSDLRRRNLERARELGERQGVAGVSAEELSAWLADERRTTYLLDVRTPDEFRSGTVPRAVSAPGGQLIQATDQWIGVRNSRIVLADDDGSRATVVAAWLMDLGWEAYVLRGGVAAASGLKSNENGRSAEAVLPAFAVLDAASLGQAVRSAVLIDGRASMRYRKGHIDGAVWGSRARPERIAAEVGTRPVLVIADSILEGRALAGELSDCGLAVAGLHVGSPDAWREAGLAVVSSDTSPPDEDCIDFLFFVHDRHEGNLDAARQYLAWETNLLAGIDEQERATFRLADAQ